MWSVSLHQRDGAYGLLAWARATSAPEGVGGVGVVAAAVSVKDKGRDAQVAAGGVRECVDELGGVVLGLRVGDGVFVTPRPVTGRLDGGAAPTWNGVRPVV